MLSVLVFKVSMCYDRWTQALGEVLKCEVEDGNTSDTYTIAIKKGGKIIGHVPGKISAACNLFLVNLEDHCTASLPIYIVDILLICPKED